MLLNISKSDRIAQFVLTKYETPEIMEVIETDNTERGAKGLGSSGV